MTRIRTLYRRHLELVHYCIVGVTTTIITLVVYFLLVRTLLDPTAALELQLANIISWLCGVMYSYSANRHFVFHSRNRHIIREGTSFFLSRALTLLLDMLVMFAMVTLLDLRDEPAKAVSVVLQTVANYVLSKFVVFHKRRRD